jgi:hypothetical protein
MEGVNIIMQIKLSPEQEAFVKIANDKGFTTEITRKDILSLESNDGAKWPRWLVRSSAYRIGRGSYSLPTLGQVTEAEDSAKGE